MSFHLQDQGAGSGYAIELAFSQAVSAPLVSHDQHGRTRDVHVLDNAVEGAMPDRRQ